MHNKSSVYHKAKDSCALAKFSILNLLFFNCSSFSLFAEIFTIFAICLSFFNLPLIGSFIHLTNVLFYYIRNTKMNKTSFFHQEWIVKTRGKTNSSTVEIWSKCCGNRLVWGSFTKDMIFLPGFEGSIVFWVEAVVYTILSGLNSPSLGSGVWEYVWHVRDGQTRPEWLEYWRQIRKKLFTVFFKLWQSIYNIKFTILTISKYTIKCHSVHSIVMQPSPQSISRTFSLSLIDNMYVPIKQ